jgi:hypothetical protein
VFLICKDKFLGKDLQMKGGCMKSYLYFNFISTLASYSGDDCPNLDPDPILTEVFREFR